jgi:hypothetical protein
LGSEKAPQGVPKRNNDWNSVWRQGRTGKKRKGAKAQRRKEDGVLANLGFCLEGKKELGETGTPTMGKTPKEPVSPPAR